MQLNWKAAIAFAALILAIDTGARQAMGFMLPPMASELAWGMGESVIFPSPSRIWSSGWPRPSPASCRIASGCPQRLPGRQPVLCGRHGRHRPLADPDGVDAGRRRAGRHRHRGDHLPAGAGRRHARGSPPASWHRPGHRLGRRLLRAACLLGRDPDAGADRLEGRHAGARRQLSAADSHGPALAASPAGRQ